MINYDCWTCKCGRIHISQKNDTDWIKKNPDRSVVRVCSICGEGSKLVVDNQKNNIFDYRGKITEYIVSSHTCKVYLDRGYKVPLMNGHYANEYVKNKYANSNDLKEIFKNIDPFVLSLTDIPPEQININFSKFERGIFDKDVWNSIKEYLIG